MVDNIKEIRDDEINVEEIMEKIREKVRNKKNIEKHPIKNGVYLNKSQNNIRDDFTKDSRFNINSLNSKRDIQNNTYIIRSHRPFVGKMLVKGRQIVNNEIRRYIDPVIWKQSDFNEIIVQIFTDYEKRIIDLEDNYNEITHRLDKIEDNLSILNKFDQNNPLFPNIMDTINELKTQINHFRSEILWEHEKNAKFDSIDTGKKSTKKLSYLNYFDFEEHFRGSRELIKKRQQKYLLYFDHCSNVLDIGCGRGEFLELLKETGIGGKGIDINVNMIDYSRSKGLEVTYSDAIKYLENLENNSLDGIFCDQVIEHLKPDYLDRLLYLCYQKLIKDFTLVLGTVNILNPRGLANFFIDPTHISPIHPEYLKYCLETIGFTDIKIIYQTYDENETDQSISNLQLTASDYVIIGKK